MPGLPSLFEIISHPEHYIMDYPLYRWYKGKVEDVNDPDKLGRVRVRVEEVWNSLPPTEEDLTPQVPTNALPWADILITGHCNKSGLFTVPPVGCAVVVAFEKGQEEHPLVIGSWWGVDSNSNPIETEIPLAARGGDQTGETGNDKKGNDTAATAGGGTITEPADPYGAEYPQNTVYRSPAGHLIEIDNTEGKERINIVHKAGTWAEFHPDGTLVFGVQKDRYSVVKGNDAEHVVGNQDVVVDGDATLKATNYKNDVTADYTQVVTGNTNLTTSANKTETVTGNSTSTVNGNNTETVVGTNTVTVTGATSAHTAPAVTVTGVATAVLTAPATTVVGTTSLTLTTPLLNMGASGGPFFPVVTTGTHPVDYITGLPIIGVPTVLAG